MITINWHDPDKTTLRWLFSGRWTTNEFDHVLLEFQDLLATASQPMTVILDMHEGVGPKNLIQLAIKGFSNPARNFRQIIVIGHIPTWKSLFSILIHRMDGLSVPIEFVETRLEADQFLSSVEHSHTRRQQPCRLNSNG